MKLVRLVTVSVLPCVACALAAGCGSGGGYRGAFTDRGGSGGESVGAGAGGAGAGAAGGGGIAAEGGLAAGAGGIGGAGQAGNAGAEAGFAGTGGFSGTAGTAGRGGDGNSGGAAGFASGGIGATSGAGGSTPTAGGGFGGFAATAGGGLAGSAGNAGASGTSSGGTAGSGGPTRTCAERCNVDTDCRVFSVDLGYRCNSSSHRCERFAEPCRSSIECVPDASAWIFACTTDADCFFFSDDLCVDVGGVGRCARLAPSANGCADPNPDEITLPRFGASGTALVCANTTRSCSEGRCVPGCATNADCSPERNGSVCDTNARLCRCARDQDCGGAGVSRCNVTTGRCECSIDQDCSEVPNANVCSAGRCGCSAVSACNAERTFSNTTYVCE